MLNPDFRTQQIVLSARSEASSLGFVLDGRVVAREKPPFRLSWELSAGSHVLRVETPDGKQSEPVRFFVSEG